jgi:hypothetical protein
MIKIFGNVVWGVGNTEHADRLPQRDERQAGWATAPSDRRASFRSTSMRFTEVDERRRDAQIEAGSILTWSRRSGRLQPQHDLGRNLRILADMLCTQYGDSDVVGSTIPICCG